MWPTPFSVSPFAWRWATREFAVKRNTEKVNRFDEELLGTGSREDCDSDAIEFLQMYSQH